MSEQMNMQKIVELLKIAVAYVPQERLPLEYKKAIAFLENEMKNQIDIVNRIKEFCNNSIIDSPIIEIEFQHNDTIAGVLKFIDSFGGYK